MMIIIMITVMTIMMMVIFKFKTDRTFHSNKAVNIIRDNKKKTSYINRQCSFRRLKYDRENSIKIYCVYRPYNQNTSYMECKGKNDVRNNSVNWGYLKIIYKLSKQRTLKTRHQGIT